MPEIPLPPDLFIVGVPRSGTSLAQRLAVDAGSASLPETHFGKYLSGGLLNRHRKSLGEAAIRVELQRYEESLVDANFGLNHEKVVEILDGNCNRPIDLYGAITRAGAGVGNDTHVTEKTPNHWRYWRPLGEAAPDSMFVWVERNPLAVVSSWRQVSAEWAQRRHPLEVCAQWHAALKERQRAQDLFGHRVVSLDFDFMIRRPGDVVAGIRSLVTARGIAPSDPSTPSRTSIVLPTELWKANVDKPPQEARIDAWQRELPTEIIRMVLASCGEKMLELGLAEAKELSRVPSQLGNPSTLLGSEREIFDRETALIESYVASNLDLDLTRNFGNSDKDFLAR